jgi:hypothetical protein
MPPFTTEEAFPRHVIATAADPAGDAKLLDAFPDSSMSAITRPLGLRKVSRTPAVPATVTVLFGVGNSQMWTVPAGIGTPAAAIAASAFCNA